MVDEAHVAWGGACWGGSFQYGLGTKWFNGVSNGNTIALSLPYLGNLSVWDSFAITACEPGSVTVGSWAQHPPHPGYCQGAPSQTLTLPLNVCKYDALAGDYKKLLNDACSLPMDSRFFFFDLFYGTSCAPSTLIHSASYWSGSAGQAPDDGSQCQYAEVPSYYGSYQCGTIALLPPILSPPYWNSPLPFPPLSLGTGRAPAATAPASRPPHSAAALTLSPGTRRRTPTAGAFRTRVSHGRLQLTALAGSKRATARTAGRHACRQPLTQSTHGQRQRPPHRPRPRQT